MAYFANGSEGACFDNECANCKYGQAQCPIAYVQIQYNYDAVNNKTATEILDHLVKPNGKCTMKELVDPEARARKRQLSLLETHNSQFNRTPMMKNIPDPPKELK